MAFSAKSIVLVTIQFLCLGILLMTGPKIATQTGILLLEVFSIILGLWAIFSMRSGKLNVFPEVRTGAILITKGPYRWIRHPMYLAVILLGLSLLLNDFSWWRAGVWGILCMNLLLKIRHEEKILIVKIPEYSHYIQSTKRLIPFLF